MLNNDIEHIFANFKSQSNINGRFTSFDFCYNYSIQADNKTLHDNMEKSCLALGFYLASWGMFRNSFLLGKSIKYYEKTIEYFASLDKSVWQIDVNNYTDDNLDIILEIYAKIKENFVENNCADLTLVTKVQLGVFGSIPAFDEYFSKTFRDLSKGKCGFRKVNKKPLKLIKLFYDKNNETIDKLAKSTFTLDFNTGTETKISYPKAKIIDIYGFSKR